MKKHMLIAGAGIWILIAAAAYQGGLFSMAPEDVEQMLRTSRSHVYLLFCVLFSLRLLFFIPSSVFIIAGAVLFSPVEGIVLSSFCMLITSSILYVVGRQFTDSPVHRFIHDKYPDIYEKMQTDRRYLFFVVLMPIAPTDAACIMAASAQMKYRFFITTILAGVIPFTTLYTFFGEALVESPIAALLVTAVIGGVFVVEMRARKKEREKELHL